MRRHQLFLTGLTSIAAVCGRAGAAVITVGNPSFETPVIPSGSTYTSPGFPNDTSGVFNAWEGVTATGGEFTAVLQNASFGNFSNATGVQTADIGAGPNTQNAATFGIFQDTTSYGAAADPNSLWQANQTYTLTVGVGNRGNLTASRLLDIRLFYRPADQGPANVLAQTQATVAGVGTTSLTTETVTFTPQDGDPEIGKPVDIWIVPDTANVVAGGDWVVDNVNLSYAQSTVPEPASLTGITLAGGMLLARRRGLILK